MDAERKEDGIHVYLTAEEVLAVQQGKSVGTRAPVIMSDAKVVVCPMKEIREDESGRYRYALDRQKRALTALLEGILDTSGDLSVYVPKIALCDVRVPGKILPKEAITIFSSPKEASELRKLIPEEGVKLHFGGSLKVVDVYPSF